MKKTAMILVVVLLLAAIGIGILVSQKNRTNADLKAAQGQVADTQALLDASQAQASEAETLLAAAQGELDSLKAELATAKTDLAAALASADATSADLGGQLTAVKAEYDGTRTALEQSLRESEAARQQADAKALELGQQLGTVTAERDAALNKSTELVALVDTITTENGLMKVDLDAAKAQVAGLEAERDTALARVTQLEDALKLVETAQAEATPEPAAESEAPAGETAQAEATPEPAVESEAPAGEAAAVEATPEPAAESEAPAEEAAAAEATLEPAVESDVPAGEAAAADATPEPAVEGEAPAEEAVEPAADSWPRHGLGMVTGIGSVSDAGEGKAGAAQVNTTVCAVTLDAEGRILTVIWDVQQTKITFTAEGKPVELPEALLTKLEKGDAYGMKSRSGIGREWHEQIAAFGEYVVGKTLDEVLAMPVFDREDGSHNAVPDVEELKASVTITVGDYLAALEKAVANAK